MMARLAGASTVAARVEEFAGGDASNDDAAGLQEIATRWSCFHFELSRLIALTGLSVAAIWRMQSGLEDTLNALDGPLYWLGCC